MKPINYEIKKRDDGRFLIVEPQNGAILSDAQGFGYRSYGAAANAARLAEAAPL